jgi:hypothetical protein
MPKQQNSINSIGKLREANQNRRKRQDLAGSCRISGEGIAALAPQGLQQQTTENRRALLERQNPPPKEASLLVMFSVCTDRQQAGSYRTVNRPMPERNNLKNQKAESRKQKAPRGAGLSVLQPRLESASDTVPSDPPSA